LVSGDWLGPFFGWLGDRFQQPSSLGAKVYGNEHPTGIALTLRILFERGHFKRPQLIVLQNDEQLIELKQALTFFGLANQTHDLTEIDASPFSEIHSNQRSLGQRVQWLVNAAILGPKDIFLATAAGLSQKTLHPDAFTESIFELTPNKEIPANFLEVFQAQGYHNVSQVEDFGQISQRGGVVDIFSPAHQSPVRIELFGDVIESLRFFDPNSQLSLGPCSKAYVTPPREFVISDDKWSFITDKLMSLASAAQVSQTVLSGEVLKEATYALSKNRYFPGIEKLLPLLSDHLAFPTDYFMNGFDLWVINSHAVVHQRDDFFARQKEEQKSAQGLGALFKVSDYFVPYEPLAKNGKLIFWETIEFIESNNTARDFAQYEIQLTTNSNFAELRDSGNLTNHIVDLKQNHNHVVLLSVQNETSLGRLKSLLDLESLLLKPTDFSNADYLTLMQEQSLNPKLIHYCLGTLPASLTIESDRLSIIRDTDLLGKVFKKPSKQSASAHFMEHAQALNFGDIKVGDHLVHKTHGIGVYKGLKMMMVKDVPTEFLEVAYKDNDRLYIPVYRLGLVQKFSGPTSPNLIDKLGGQGWQKTTLKVRSSLRDIASQLIQIYAERAAHKRIPYPSVDHEDLKFDQAFPFEETDDQIKSIEDIYSDLTSDKIMDRLICGDVGFGKTEVAMRAAFKVAQSGKQVAVIVPTTILSFQHSETFKKRFQKWPMQIGSFNRFVDGSEIKKNITKLKEGQLDIAIGTHRLLSKDVTFKNLGLMIIDEEQKFGVRHKERLRQISKTVDTLTLSATPIPRTLNMSLMGIRDLSLITTPPVDRLPTRTYVARFDIGMIKKAIQSEVDRGGQVYFLHNRVASIEGIAFDLKQALPGVRFAIGHGQMDEHQLEDTMIKFVNKEVDVLICTTIIESGTDIPNANTMIINDAQNLGLSQLYQLRGRVGRSKERAYCYLVIPPNLKLDKEAQERLRVIQENTSLGSGFKIAQYDLELRGSGDLLGEKQSGHIEAVGYELYMDLLEDAVRELKGDAPKSDFDPEINLPIPAFFPDSYMPDIRLRLAYYKILSQVKTSEEVDKVEEELRDQFGPPPLEVVNLLGFMLIRKACKELGVTDVSGGKNTFALKFSNDTPVTPQKIIEVTQRDKNKYSLTPDQRLRVRIANAEWPEILKEIEILTRNLLS
jgi:transcription-repair coupling factor (superfamily II helicase)